jgi:hypothetical protein
VAVGLAQRQLHALVVAAPDTLRGRLGGLTTHQLVSTCGRLRLRAAWDAETIATTASLRALARRIQLLEAEIADHTRAITTLVGPGTLSCSPHAGWARSWPPSSCAPGPTRAAAKATPPSPCSPGRPDPRLQRPIRRCLVRHVARQPDRLLETNPALDQHRSVQGNDLPSLP